MNWEKELFISKDEKPLDRLVDGYSNTSIFRTVGFIGDSLSSGEFESRDAEGNPGYHDYYEYSWGQYLARKNGLKAYNFSRGGMTAKEYMTSFAEKKGYWDPALACQAYVIALGVNDITSKSTTLGSIEDIDPVDWHKNQPTCIGYYAQIVSRIKEEIQPDAKFFFVTMMCHEGDTPERAEKRRKHTEMLYALAEHFDHAYVIDLYQYGPRYDEKYKEVFNLYHHLNPMGYMLTAKNCRFVYRLYHPQKSGRFPPRGVYWNEFAIIKKGRPSKSKVMELLMKNPVSDHWYADPESRVYGDTVYMYVTRSLKYEDQQNLDLVASNDLKEFKSYYGILDMSTYKGVEKAVWAPTVIDQNGKYYIIFAANDIKSEEEIGGLYLGVSDSPTGPFQNVFEDGRPLLNSIFNNAQPIDAHLFKDDDGSIYLYYGGWKHMMVCKMNAAMNGFEPMPAPSFDGIARELTPVGYVEGPYVMKIDGRYHLMYSSGNWTNSSYCVKAAVADSPCGEFTYYGDILKAGDVADGPGHNSAFCFHGEWYVAYHRRIVGDKNAHHRRLCIDKLPIRDGKLQPVVMT